MLCHNHTIGLPLTALFTGELIGLCSVRTHSVGVAVTATGWLGR